MRLLKPEAAIFRCLLDKYALRAEESVFIDDTPANVDGARRAGLHGLHFTDTPTLRKDLDILLKP